MNFLKKTFVLFSCFLLTGCTTVSYFYFVNLSHQPVELVLKFNGTIAQLTSSSENLLVFQSATTSSKQIDTLIYRVVDDSSLAAEFPANSKTLVAKFLITPESVKEIAILRDGSSQRFSTEQIYKQVNVKQGLFKPIIYTFQID